MTDVISDAPAPEPEEDLEVIAPPPGDPFPIGAESPGGPVMVRVNRLRTVEFLALMRCLARGLGPGIAELDFTAEGEEQVGQVVGIMLTALPNASTEFMQFVQTVTVAVGKDDKKRVADELANPSLDDMLAIVERVVENELPDLRELVGKAQAMWGRVSKMYARTSNAG